MKKLLFVVVIVGVVIFVVVQDEIKFFIMDGEFGFIVIMGNIEIFLMIVGIIVQQEFENWLNDYVLEGLYKKEIVLVDGVEVECIFV